MFGMTAGVVISRSGLEVNWRNVYHSDWLNEFIDNWELNSRRLRRVLGEGVAKLAELAVIDRNLDKHTYAWGKADHQTDYREGAESRLCYSEHMEYCCAASNQILCLEVRFGLESKCPYCSLDPESEDHLFFSCVFAPSKPARIRFHSTVFNRTSV